MVRWVLLVPLLLCMSPDVIARPSRTIPYFPHYNPWDLGDIGIHEEDNRGLAYNFPDDSSNQLNKYFYSLDPNENLLSDRSSQEDIQRSVPVYEKGKGGFVPSSVSALDNVYWWKKRFNGVDIPPSDDLPYFDDDYDTNIQGSMKKRDYTAAQLVNMLKALAKARRQRNIRIAGKGLRFGISR